MTLRAFSSLLPASLLLLLALAAAPAPHLAGAQAGAAVPPPACFDGLDNDGDERVDWPDDASCTDALDDTEDECVVKTVRSSVSTAFQTRVDHVATARFSCPAGPELRFHDGACSSLPTWRQDACRGWRSGLYSDTKGDFACEAGCLEGVDPHWLMAGVVVYNGIGPACSGGWTINVDAFVVVECWEVGLAATRAPLAGCVTVVVDPPRFDVENHCGIS